MSSPGPILDRPATSAPAEDPPRTAPTTTHRLIGARFAAVEPPRTRRGPSPGPGGDACSRRGAASRGAPRRTSRRSSHGAAHRPAPAARRRPVSPQRLIRDVRTGRVAGPDINILVLDPTWTSAAVINRITHAPATVEVHIPVPAEDPPTTCSGRPWPNLGSPRRRTWRQTAPRDVRSISINGSVLLTCDVEPLREARHARRRSGRLHAPR
jgi:hypothetical protein